jgi:hypothetical protein
MARRYAVTREDVGLVFLSGFVVSLFLSAFSFYVLMYSLLGGLLGFVGLFIINVVSAMSLRKEYLLGVGLGVVAGFFGWRFVKMLFDALMYAGIYVGMSIGRAVTPQDYKALALLVALVFVVYYALAFGIHSICTSLYVYGILSLYSYPDLVLGMGLAVFYPFYVSIVYLTVWSFLVLFFAGAVAMFWIYKVGTTLWGIAVFAEIGLLFAGTMVLPRLLSGAVSSIASSIFDLMGLEYVPEELDVASRRAIYLFMLYSVLAGLGGFATAYYGYAAVFMVGMAVAGLGVWSTFVNVPLYLSGGRLSWRIVRRVINSGVFAIALICVGIMVGYGHCVYILRTAVSDFIQFYSGELYEFMYEVFSWLLTY